MKQKDLALIIVAGVFSAIFSVVLSNYFITPNKIKQQQAEVVDPISSTFDVPSSDNKYFNKNAVNPTKLIQIGDSTNKTPFSGDAN